VKEIIENNIRGREVIIDNQVINYRFQYNNFDIDGHLLTFFFDDLDKKLQYIIHQNVSVKYTKSIIDFVFETYIPSKITEDVKLYIRTKKIKKIQNEI